MLPQRFQLPSIASGYPLNPAREWISIVIPRATTNLFLNPSFETGTDNWNSEFDGVPGVPFQRTTDAQYRGAWAAQLTILPGGTYVAIFNNDSVTPGTVYSLTAHIKRPGNVAISPDSVRSVFNTVSLPFHRVEYSADGWWRCISTFIGDTGLTGVLVQGAPGDIFYVDALQLEESEPTTYCDGDEAGLLPLESPPAYRWNGTPHASTSSRSGQTKSGGVVRSLSHYGATLVALAGLGMAPVVNAETPLGLIDGSVYQQTTREARTFTMGMRFQGETPIELAAGRAGLRSAVSSLRTALDQPTRLIFQKHLGKRAIGDEAIIDAAYMGGLEGNESSLNAEDASVQFRQFFPLISGNADRGTDVDTRDTPTIAYVAVRNRESGEWFGLGSLNAVPQPNAMIFGPDNKLYVGGNFTTPGTRVARYNFESAAWETLSTGLGQQVNALVFDPNGILYAGLNAAVTIGLNTGSVARWDGASWTVISGAPSDQIFALAYDPVNRRLYTGGVTGGNATLRYWNGSSWTAVTIATAGTVFDLVFDPAAALLYVAGSFTNLNGSAPLDNIATYNGTTLGELAGGANNTVRSVALRANGALVAAGTFTTIGGVTATSNNAEWNGRSWSNLSGLESDSLAGVAFIGVDPVFGSVYSTGDGTATTFVATSIARPVVIYDGSTSLRLPGALFAADANAVNGVAFSGLYVAVSYNVSGTLPSAGATAINNPGTAPSYPTIVFGAGATATGASGIDGVYQVLNWTTGQQIGVNFTLFANERITLNCETLTLTSNVRGILSNAINPGSVPLTLGPGDNLLYVFTSDPATNDLTAHLYFTPQYEGFDALVASA